MKRNSAPLFQITGVVYWLVPARRLTWLFILETVDRNQRIGLVIVAGSVCVVGEVVLLGRELIQEEIWC